MESVMEPKKTVYIEQRDDYWFVWSNTDDPLCPLDSFNSYEEALVFAQSWADGITAKDEVECEVVTACEPSATESPVTELDIATTVGAFIKVLAPLFEALKAFNESMPIFVDNAMVFKRLYLGSTYAYNILSRCRFLVKSPKVVKRVADITIWMFMHLPKRLILKWPSPKLRD